MRPIETRYAGYRFRSRPAAKGAVSIDVALSSEPIREELLREAKRELVRFAAKYRQYRELFAEKEPAFANLFEAIEQIEANNAGSGSEATTD